MQTTRTWNDIAALAPQTPAGRAGALDAAIGPAARFVAAPLHRLAGRLRRARRARATCAQLDRLSDHELDDIGILRAEIGPVAEALAAEPRGSRLTIAELRQRLGTAPGTPSTPPGARALP